MHKSRETGTAINYQTFCIENEQVVLVKEDIIEYKVKLITSRCSTSK